MAELVVITALLPLTALMLVTQTNPYHALVIRGILGAVAALVYAIFGAADVALTEALVGTMLAITLYAVAVRSSMSFRLGVLEQGNEVGGLGDELSAPSELAQSRVKASEEALPEAIATALRQGLQRHHLRLEPVSYDSEEALKEAIECQEVHAILQLSVPATVAEAQDPPSSENFQPPQLHIRLPRLHSLLQGELSSELAHLKLLP